MMKRVVDRMLPCGMPCVMSCGLDCACGVWVVCMRPVKYEVKSASVVGWKLYLCLSMFSSLWCEMVSYALVRSMRMDMTECFLSFECCGGI